MASSKLTVHIPPDANPSNVLQMILVLIENQGIRFGTAAELLQYLEEKGISNRTEIQSTAVALGILRRGESQICLSENGISVARARSEVYGDLLHFLLYTSWSDTAPLEFLQSWSYRECCLRYWREGRVELTPEYLDRQVSEFNAYAPQAFAHLGEFSDVSFSRKSLTGAYNWLSALNPPVVQGRVFERRTFCPPELVILALGYAVRDEQGVTEYDVLLTREKRETICQVCLLEPNHLDRTLDWAMSVFPQLTSPGTKSPYGRFVRLHKLPSIEDILR